ncbi:MAG TPA: hypothetical protein VFY75_07905 [Solirubrobacterales bacterium]|nr:hypothetical protein [Solirubrobacterales bacterium]
MTVAEARTLALPLEDPYVGLTHFTEEYADFFFGREAESSLIIGNLRASRLTLLYAQSGVGKSSALRAGVVARMREVAARDLEARGAPRLVPVVFSSWSERPVAMLVHAIDEAIRPYLGEADPPALPEDDLEAALEAASQALEATLLVILDQFEEYFLYPDDAPEPERIAAQIARCVNRADLRANFLISIREDAYAELGDLFRGKVKNVYGNFLHLDFLNRAGAREAIERPIQRLNELQPEAEPFSLEPELVEAVLGQVGHDEEDDRIETTYLQLVMRRLWEEETETDSRVLRLATLERLGGAQAIIGSHLDRAMEGGGEGGGLSAEQRLIAAAAFRFLVTSGGTKIALTASDLAELTGFSGAEVQPVLRHLSSPRLHILRPVVFEEGDSEPRYEIFHDALAEPIREWRMRVEEEERNARRRRERAEKEEAQRAAAEAEQRAERERQRKRVAQGLLALAVVALLAVATYFAFHQRDLAEKRDAANQSARAAKRIEYLSVAPNFGPTPAALASIEAYELSPTIEARNQALAQLQTNPGLPRVFSGHTRSVNVVAFWPGSKKLASGSSDGTVRLWSENGREIGSPLVSDGEVVTGLAVSEPMEEGARILAAAYDSGFVDFWKIDREGEVEPGSHEFVPITGSELHGLAFDPRRPRTLAVGGEDGSLTLMGVERGSKARILDQVQVSGTVEDLAFTADGRLLVAAGRRGVIVDVTAAGFAGSQSIRTAGNGLAVATAPNGSYGFGGDRGIIVWDDVGERELRLQSPGDVYSLAFARGGSAIVAGGESMDVTSWDVETGRSFGPPRPTNFDLVADVAVSEDGDTIAGASLDGLVKLWPLEPRARPPLAQTVGSLAPGEAGGDLPTIYALAVGAGGRLAAAGGEAGTSIWSLRDLPEPDRPPEPLARIKGRSYAVAYEVDVLVTGRGNSFAVYGTGGACRGKGAEPCLLGVPAKPHSDALVESLAVREYGSRVLLASTGARAGKGVFNLWDLSRAKETGEIDHLSSRPLETEIRQLSFSPGAPLLAAGTDDGKTRVWDVSDPRDPDGVTIKHARGNENQPVTAIAFSRDGSLLASGGQDQQVVLWRVRGAPGNVTVEGTPQTLVQTQTIFALAFSPDGETLAVGDGDGATCLYDVATRQVIGSGSVCLLGPHTESEGGVNALKFANLRGQKPVLLSAGTGQSIVRWDSLLWNLSEDDQVEDQIAGYLCTLAGRNLTPDEWSSVFLPTDLADDYHGTCDQPSK